MVIWDRQPRHVGMQEIAISPRDLRACPVGIPRVGARDSGRTWPSPSARPSLAKDLQRITIGEVRVNNAPVSAGGAPT